MNKKNKQKKKRSEAQRGLSIPLKEVTIGLELLS